MAVTERLEAIARQCRTRYYAFPESLITAICQYVSGEGSLAAVQREWQAAGQNTRILSERFIVVSDPNTQQLDEMDLRMLDICMTVGTISAFLSKIAANGPIEQAYDYLLSKGMSKQDLLPQIMACYYLFDAEQKPNALWLDPVKYRYLVEEAAVAPNPDLGKNAVRLLKWGLPKLGNFEQARPILQRCIASGTIEAALEALDVLLEQAWPERQAYVLSLLAHRSKQIRDALIKWLVQQGESIIEPLAPYVAHANADARLAAVQALQRIGGEQARALLTARLDAEKSLKVKQAILDAVGAAAVVDSSQAASASPIEALAAEAEAALKRGAKPALPWFDAAQMPGLRWKQGDLVPSVVMNYLLYLQSRVKLSKLDERIQQALPLIDRSSSGDLALALFNGWVAQGAASAEAWCLPLLCALADERLILPLRQQIDDWTKGTRGALAAKAVGAMALIESDLALAEINDLAERVKQSQVKAAAQKALEDAAEHRHISLEELSDLIVPTLGFNDKGERVFDYGPRQFTVRLKLDQTLQITDNAGKRVTNLPRPGARDDESKASAALAAWSLLKKQVPLVIKMQAQRLENALINQRAWSVARWQALFLKHPLLRSFAIALIWGVVTPGQSAYQALFRPLEDGSLTDAEDNAVTLPPRGNRPHGASA